MIFCYSIIIESSLRIQKMRYFCSFLFALVIVSFSFSQESEVLKITDGRVQIEGNLEVNGTVQDRGGLLTPAGSILAYAGTDAPEGWLLCDGAEVSREDYALLFSLIGTAFGEGNGSSTFNLPDMRGVFLRGAGANGTMRKADETPYDGGELGTKREDSAGPHTHDIDHDHPSFNISGGKHYHRIGPVLHFSNSGSDSNGENGSGAKVDRTATDGAHTHTVDVPALGHTDSGSAEGPRSGDETAPASVSVHYIIKY